MIEQQEEWPSPSGSSRGTDKKVLFEEQSDVSADELTSKLRPAASKSSIAMVKAAIAGGQADPPILSIENRGQSVSEPIVPRLSLAHAIAKRVFDVAGAVAIAVFMFPVFVGIAIAIRLSGSPVFFAHERVGRGRKPFNCYKFRSMVPDAESALQQLLRSSPAVLREWRENHKLKDDPRITPFGHFLRRSSLDELPQLWNVIKGEMSLVGPRPIVADELERFGNKASIYCAVKPGMTGLWQVMGRSTVTYSRRVSMDVFYVQKQSIALDIWILFRTVFVVIRRVGAH